MAMDTMENFYYSNSVYYRRHLGIQAHSRGEDCPLSSTPDRETHPRVVSAIVEVLLGWLVGWLVRSVVVSLVRRVPFTTHNTFTILTILTTHTTHTTYLGIPTGVYTQMCPHQ
ncbi:hypothetical protein F4859DRAFT_485276 [Xylaria cf. heliscus]|nr:hypothetical protein F4859DRAFT_485276 [Xylaria cf. heliscus]